MPQSECFSISQQLKKVAGRIATGDDHDVGNPSIHQRLNRIIDHRLVVDGQEMLVGYRG